MNKSENTKSQTTGSHSFSVSVSVSVSVSSETDMVVDPQEVVDPLNRHDLWKSGILNNAACLQTLEDTPLLHQPTDLPSAGQVEASPPVHHTLQHPEQIQVSTTPVASPSIKTQLTSRMSLPEPLNRPNKRQLRWRSRSLSNLFLDAIPPCKIQKHRSDSCLSSSSSSSVKNTHPIFASPPPPPPPPPPLSPSCFKHRSRKRFSHSASNIALTPPIGSSLSSLATTSMPAVKTCAPLGPILPPTRNTSASSSLSSAGSPNTSTSISYALQPPPVNSASLREIDLQEIFKNPQLRHDIVFDPQLQFRPNLDGERGRRKRAVAEKYWESIVLEFTDLVNAQDSPSPGLQNPHTSRLPLLFSTLKEILMSLLPTKDRPYADSVLDSDLMIQQLSRGALDFLALAKWLAFVFKAHCAPMRDSWVDQMVARIEMGIASKSPKRLVEGLRMVFAILEAMKLDVANHQIRTLRPILVNSAVEFEQEYYVQYVERGKIDFTDSLKWFSKSSTHFTESGCEAGQDKHRQSFVYGMLKLITCSGNDIVSEFPSTFGFDSSRLSSFRAELRRIVCLHLCVLLYQQLIQQQQQSSTKLAANETQALLGPDSVDKLKKDILAIIGDSMGNAKWTKNTTALGLEISKRAYNMANRTNVTSAPSAMSEFASGWLCKQLQPKSSLYGLLEKRARESIFNSITKNLSVFCALDACNLNASSAGNGFVDRESHALAGRMIVLARFHWAVFGKHYVTYVSKEQGIDGDVKSEHTAVEPSPMMIDEETSGAEEQEHVVVRPVLI